MPTALVHSLNIFLVALLCTLVCTISNMVGRAKSATKKAQLSWAEKDCVMAQAVAAYQAKLEKISPEKKGLQKICMEVTKAYKKETGKEIHLNHNTLNNLTNSGQ